MPFGRLPLYARIYLLPPTIAISTAPYFDSLGGDSITITGTDLTGASITVGGTSATVTASSPTSLTFTTPAKAAGTANIVATNAAGSSSGFTCESVSVTGIGGTCRHWFRSSLGLSNTSGIVTQWVDQGVGGANLSSTNSSMPRYFSSDVAFNNLPCIGTSGVEVRNIVSGTLLAMVSPATYYEVFNLPASGSYSVTNSSGNMGGASDNAHWMYATPSSWISGSNDLSCSGSTGIPGATTWVVCSVIGTSSGFYANNTSTNLGACSYGTATATSMGFGGRSTFAYSGEWKAAEHIAFAGIAHDATQRTKMMKILGLKYGVTIT